MMKIMFRSVTFFSVVMPAHCMLKNTPSIRSGSHESNHERVCDRQRNGFTKKSLKLFISPANK